MSKHTLYFKVKGLTCGSCEKGLEALTKEYDSVEGCSASHMQGLLKVQLKNKFTKQEIKTFSHTLVDEISGIYPLEVTKNPFSAASKFEPKPYATRALINIGVGLLWFLAKGALPVITGAMGLGLGFGLHALVLATMFWTGYEFYQDAWKQMKHRSTNMNTLVSVSTLLAWTHSLMNLVMPTVFTGALFSFMPIFMILGLTNLGRSIRQKAEQKAHALTQNFDEVFSKYHAAQAKRCVNEAGNRFETIAAIDIQVGDILEVQEGEPFPTDGELLSKGAWVNQKVLTGESFAQRKQRHDVVFGGTINTQGTVQIQATKKEQDSALMRLLARVRAAQLGRAQTYAWVDTISQRFVPVVFSVALFAGGAWLALTATPLLAFNAMISVLLCACPCALGLAAPITNALGLYKLLHHGVLVKDADSLKALSEADTFVFDKTGTLTEPHFAQAQWALGYEKLGPQWVASLEHEFAEHHPIAKACLGLEYSRLLSTQNAKKHPSGQGVEGLVESNQVLVGSSTLMSQENIDIPLDFVQGEQSLREKGLTPILVCVNQQIVGVMGFEHRLKSNAASTLKLLKEQGYHLHVLTGDSHEATQNSLKGLPLDTIKSQLTAEQKKDEVSLLKQQGFKVAYVGDGLNDLEAAQLSDVAISIEAWTHMASHAQISLKSELNAIPHAVKVGRMIQNNIKQNLAWTFFYNSISLLVASGALTPWLGVALNPVIFTGTMALSSIVVITNALRIPGLIQNYYQSQGISSTNETGQKTPSPTWGEKLHTLVFDNHQAMDKNKAPQSKATVADNPRVKPAIYTH